MDRPGALALTQNGGPRLRSRLVCEVLCQASHRIALPGKVGVEREPLERCGDLSEARCRGRERCESRGELRSSFGAIQILGERGHGPAVKFQSPSRIAPCGEQELGAPQRRGNVTLVEREIVSRKQAKEHETIVTAGRLCGPESTRERNQIIVRRRRHACARIRGDRRTRATASGACA